MTYNSNFPVFAQRYRFEVITGWDSGRSGNTHLAYDLLANRRGVIKRAETISKQTQGLRNEVKALKALKDLGVPEVYAPDASDIYRTEYGSKNYEYMVIEYIDGMRIEEKLDSLSIVERAEVITQLFGLLSQAHQKGIVNGDVRLKHLFQRKNKDQLIVIDWGNARLDVDPKKTTEFADDLARAAEIVFSLVTRQGHPAATGSIALPEDSALIAGLGPVPFEFRELCRWAPRTPTENAQAPFTAKELFEVSRKWLGAVARSRAYVPDQPSGKKLRMAGILLTLGILFFSAIFRFSGPPAVSVTPTVLIPITASTLTATNTPVLTQTASPTILPTETVALTTPVIPSPGIYSSIVTFDKEKKTDKCWENEAIPPSQLILNDGFYPRDNGWWGFRVVKEHSVEEVVQVDFSRCLANQQIGAIALNVAVNRLEIPSYEPSREFGIFMENQTGQRREYVLWLDKSEALYLRVREGNNNLKDYLIDVVDPAHIDFVGDIPRSPRQFPIQIFLEINNQGFDIIYLSESSLEKPMNAEFDPGQMIRMDNVILPTLGDLQKIGLMGRGGKTETLIWPLTLLERKTE